MDVTLDVSTTLLQITFENIIKITICCRILLHGVISRILKVLPVLCKQISCLIKRLLSVQASVMA